MPHVRKAGSSAEPLVDPSGQIEYSGGVPGALGTQGARLPTAANADLAFAANVNAAGGAPDAEPFVRILN